MTIVPRGDFRPLPYLAPLAALAVAIAAVFFGIAYLWLAPPHPLEPPADTGPPAQALEIHEVPPPANSDTTPGSSSMVPTDGVAASSRPAATVEQERPALGSQEIKTAMIPRASISHAKRVRVVRYHRQVIPERRAVALWRPDASAGPLPGGGFYGPPNANIGYINPR